MIQKVLLNTQTLWMIFIEILNNTIRIKSKKYWLYLMIWLLICLVTFIIERNLNISLVFITQSYFAVPKNIRLNSTHYFLIKFPNKRKLQQITFNRSSDIHFQDFMNLYKKRTAKPYFFLVIDTTLASDNSSRFRKNISERM